MYTRQLFVMLLHALQMPAHQSQGVLQAFPACALVLVLQLAMRALLHIISTDAPAHHGADATFLGQANEPLEAVSPALNFCTSLGRYISASSQLGT